MSQLLNLVSSILDQKRAYHRELSLDEATEVVLRTYSDLDPMEAQKSVLQWRLEFDRRAAGLSLTQTTKAKMTRKKVK